MDLEAAEQGKKTDEESFELNSIEKDTIGEILNISMGAGATAVSTLVGKPVDITTPSVNLVKTSEFEVKSLEPAVGIQIQYIEGLYGTNLLVMKKRDIRAIVNELLPDEAGKDDDPLTEMHMSAISEIMNQMMGASSTALSSFLGENINISTPSEFAINEIHDKLKNEQPYVVSVLFRLKVEGLIDSEFITAMPVAFTKQLVSKALHMGDEESAEPSSEEQPAQPSSEEPPAQPVPVMEAQAPVTVNKIPAREASPVSPNPAAERRTPVSVQPLQWESFDQDSTSHPAESGTENFDLIMDVPLNLSVEIGRIKMQVKEILDLRQGSIVEFDKQADDPVDVYVNGQLIAKGDVVVINDNFGVRITEIVSGHSAPEAKSFSSAGNNKKG